MVFIDPFQRIVNVSWGRDRYFMVCNTQCTDTVFIGAGGPVTIELTDINGPFVPLMLNDRHDNPVLLQTWPADYGGITEVVGNFSTTQLLVLGRILQSDKAIQQWTYAQFNNTDPDEFFKHANMAVFNLNIVNKAQTPIIEMAGHFNSAFSSEGDISFDVVHVPKNFEPSGTRDLQNYGQFLDIVHSATLGAVPPLAPETEFWTLNLDMATFAFSDPQGAFFCN